MITKAAFLSAVDLINSTMLENADLTSKFSFPSKMTADLPFFANAETEKLAMLSPNTRRSHLQILMSKLSEQAMSAATDDELLDEESKDVPSVPTSMENTKPPPIPPRAKSVSSLRLGSEKNGCENPILSYACSAKASKVMQSPQLKTVSESPLDFSTPFSANPRSSVYNSREGAVSNPPRFPREGSILQPPRSPREGSNLQPPRSPRSTRTSSTTSSTRRISTPSPERRSYPYPSNYFTVGRADSETDSSDDYEPFVPPKRSRYASEPFVHQQVLECQRERRASSPLPDFSTQQLKKSSPILTKRPGWFSKRDRLATAAKHQSEASLMLGSQRRKIETEKKRPKCRSRSADGNIEFAISPRQTNEMLAQGLYDSDDNTGGTVESKDYSKPFEHILWKKLGLDDGSAISGSLPHLDRMCMAGSKGGNHADYDAGGDDDEGCTYLDPTELEDYCERLGNKELSDRIRTRLSTVLSSTYLSLTNVQEKVADAPNSGAAASNPLDASSTPTFGELPSISPGRSNSRVLTMERFKKSGLADSISCSGYSTDADASSGFENEADSGGGFLGRMHSLRAENQYDDLSTSLGRVACSERALSRSREQQRGEEEGEGEECEYEQIYEEIDQYSDTNVELRSTTPPVAVEGMVLPVPAQKTLTLLTQHTNLHLSQSVPPHSNSFHWPNKRDGKFVSQIRKESPYATLKEVSSQIPGRCRRAPTLPPRRIKKVASLDPTQGRRKHYLRNEPKVPGVSRTRKCNI